VIIVKNKSKKANRPKQQDDNKNKEKGFEIIGQGDPNLSPDAGKPLI
jgi:hypothetical protein